jgi:Tfp pilus assembly protein PilX
MAYVCTLEKGSDMKRYLHLKGFTLFVVMIYLQLFSLLGLFGLMTGTIAIKSVQQSRMKSELLIKADSILAEIEAQSIAEITHCNIEQRIPSSLADESGEWWRQHACEGRFAALQYDYVIEPLAVDICGRADKSVEIHSLAAVYYRITLRLRPSNETQVIRMLQSTIVQLEDKHMPCQGEYHRVRLGRQMQRVLIGAY